MRVLYIARAPFVSGAERALMSMLRHLDRNRIEPHLALGHETEMSDLARDANVKTTLLPTPKRSKSSMLAWWRSLRQLKKLVNVFQPDLMHANDVPSCQAMSAVGQKMNVPRVVHIRWGITASSMAWWARTGMDQIICISQWVRDELGDLAGTSIASASCDIVPDAVDWPADVDAIKSISGSQKGDIDTTASKQVNTSKSHQIILGFTGQLIESKGLDLVIEAMGELPDSCEVKLLVAGEDTQSGGAYKKQLQQLASQCGVADRIEWLGFLDDVSQLHQRVDVMVCPSRIEPLGLVPLEAAQYQVPTIANREGGLAETIQHEKTGWLVEPTVQAWTRGLVDVAGDADRMDKGMGAYQRTIDCYSPKVYQQRLTEVYETMTKKEMQ